MNKRELKQYLQVRYDRLNYESSLIMSIIDEEDLVKNSEINGALAEINNIAAESGIKLKEKKD